MDRRLFLKRAALAGTAGAGMSALSIPNAAADARSAYATLVPEIFQPLDDPPEHTEAIIIGSGFGAAVSAHRLAEAGVTTTVLERGSRWPRSRWRPTFANDVLPDGRGFWHREKHTNYRSTLLGVAGMEYLFDEFGGVFDVVEYDNMEVWRGACVGGGSMIYAGVSLEPERRFFEHAFGDRLSYGEMHRRYYPRARSMLRVSPAPEDIYRSKPFHVRRLWDDHLTRAGYQPSRPDSTFNWTVVRDELRFRTRPSATIGESNLGNANGAKFDLTQNYLKYAEETGNATIYPGHRVHEINQDRTSNRYVVTVSKITPTGEVVRTRTLTCDRLFLGAGSIGSTELLVRARTTGALPNLNEEVGRNWGPNGEAMALHGLAQDSGPGLQSAAPCTGRAVDESGPPMSLESWYLPGAPLDPGLVMSLAMVLDDTRGTFHYDAGADRVDLDWPAGGSDTFSSAIRPVHQRIADASPRTIAPPPASALDIIDGYTAHPLGGAVITEAADGYGRLHGHPGLYVMDGAAIPGSTGTVNPSLTITALAERNIAEIIRSGG